MYDRGKQLTFDRQLIHAIGDLPAQNAKLNDVARCKAKPRLVALVCFHHLSWPAGVDLLFELAQDAVGSLKQRTLAGRILFFVA